MSDSLTKYTGAFVFALMICVVLGAANLVMGDLNQDEGWYLYAAQSVADGKLPYRDFAFTQGPMLPLVYSLIAPVVDMFGVGGGRAVTWLLGFAGALFAAGTARRLGGAAAGVIAFMLVAVNVYQSYFTTVVKTYSLCAFFMIAGFYAMSRYPGSRKSWWLAIAGAGLAAAAGTRVSSGVLLPIAGLWLLFQSGRWGKYGWLWFGAGGGAVLIAVFLPLYIAAPEGFLFGLIEYHTLRESGGVLSSLVLKAGFVSRLIQFYFVAFVLILVLAGVKLWRRSGGLAPAYENTDAFSVVRLLWISVVAVTAVHVLAPFPYDDYQTPVFPVLAVALAVSWTFAIRSRTGGDRNEGAVSDPAWMRGVVWVILFVSAASSFSSPLNMDWMISGRDRIWWIMKDKPALLQLRDVARDIRENCKSEIMLTQDTYLAVEAGKKVPSGWEMGPFSYYPDMSDERAAALHLVNKHKLIDDLLTQPADIAAFSGYGLSIASPEVTLIESEQRLVLEQALHERYKLVKEISAFGQAATRLRIFELETLSREAP